MCGEKRKKKSGGAGVHFSPRVCLFLLTVITSQSMKGMKIISPVDVEARRALTMRAGDTVRVW